MINSTSTGPVRLSNATVLPIFWWAWSLNYTNLTAPLGWEPMTRLQLGGHCIATGKTWTQGLWPTLGSARGPPVNGGIPPNASLDAHLAAVRDQIDACVPPGHTGLGVLDLEQWDPAWEMNNCSFAGHAVYPGPCPADGWRGAYQEATRAWVREANPGWAGNATRVEAAAKKAWEASASAFFVQTLELLRSLRPGMLWGVYQLPYKLHGPCHWAGDEGLQWLCGFDHPTWGPKARALYESEPVASVFRAMGVVTPSIYISANVSDNPERSQDLNMEYVCSNVREAWRLAALGRPDGEPRAPVVPFGELYYHGAFGPVNASAASSSVRLPSPDASNADDLGNDTAATPPMCNAGPRPPLSSKPAVLLDYTDVIIQANSATASGADGLVL